MNGWMERKMTNKKNRKNRGIKQKKGTDERRIEGRDGEGKRVMI